MRVLAIGAHPDDIENFCAGTLIRYARAGHEVTIAIATQGDIGAPTGTRAEIAATRHAEAEAACASIGARLIWMGYDDEFLFNDKQTRMSFIDAIREARPDVMFILSEDDYHPDHRTAGTIGRDARIPASVPLIESAFPHTPIPTTFIMDTYLGRNFDPHGYVDITDVMDAKREMLAHHVSQSAWMRSVFDTDMGDDMIRLARMRGNQAGVEYAEAFQLLSDPPYTGGWELLPSDVPSEETER
ncbi:MAG: PIG-L deacetylase family protein [Microbacterium sp.]